jgi:ubiquinone/menaquinone biosynthesis C-methylase UbiE
VGESGPANTAQVQRWNGASGQHWIEHRERHLAEHQHLTPHLFRAAAITAGDRVLDVGCGCGTTTIAAAQAAQGAAGDQWDASSPRRDERGPAGAAVGVDLSAPMLEVARQLAAQARVGNVRFVRGDAQACPLRRDSFDVMISNFGVMFFNDPRAAFTSMAAAIRPGGRLAFLCWQDNAQNEIFAIPMLAFGAHMQLPATTADDLFADPRQIRDLLASTGWQGIQVTSVTEAAWIGSDVDDVMNYTRGMPRLQSLAASLQDRALAQRVLDSIAEQYATRQGPDGVWVRAAAWVVTARRA